MKSRTQEYPSNHPLFEIPLQDSDIIETYTTNTSGNIRTNKRAWDHHRATVILGNVVPSDGKIIIPNELRVWSCEIYGQGIVSSIGLKNTEVTMIVHL